MAGSFPDRHVSGHTERDHHIDWVNLPANATTPAKAKAAVEATGTAIQQHSSQDHQPKEFQHDNGSAAKVTNVSGRKVKNRILLPRQTEAGDERSSPTDGAGATSSGDCVAESSSKPKITTVACQECQRKKCKCDGARPRCRACVRKGVAQCVYQDREDSTRLLKEKNKKLEAENRSLLNQNHDLIKEIERIRGAKAEPCDHDGPDEQNANEAIKMSIEQDVHMASMPGPTSSKRHSVAGFTPAQSSFAQERISFNNTQWPDGLMPFQSIHDDHLPRLAVESQLKGRRASALASMFAPSGSPSNDNNSGFGKRSSKKRPHEETLISSTSFQQDHVHTLNQFIPPQAAPHPANSVNASPTSTTFAPLQAQQYHGQQYHPYNHNMSTMFYAAQGQPLTTDSPSLPSHPWPQSRPQVDSQAQSLYGFPFSANPQSASNSASSSMSSHTLSQPHPRRLGTAKQSPPPASPSTDTAGLAMGSPGARTNPAAANRMAHSPNNFVHSSNAASLSSSSLGVAELKLDEAQALQDLTGNAQTDMDPSTLAQQAQQYYPADSRKMAAAVKPSALPHKDVNMLDAASAGPGDYTAPYDFPRLQQHQQQQHLQAQQHQGLLSGNGDLNMNDYAFGASMFSYREMYSVNTSMGTG